MSTGIKNLLKVIIFSDISTFKDKEASESHSFVQIHTSTYKDREAYERHHVCSEMRTLKDREVS
jgi:hypothetical protein